MPVCRQNRGVRRFFSGDCGYYPKFTDLQDNVAGCGIAHAVEQKYDEGGYQKKAEREHNHNQCPDMDDHIVLSLSGICFRGQGGEFQGLSHAAETPGVGGMRILCELLFPCGEIPYPGEGMAFYMQ